MATGVVAQLHTQSTQKPTRPFLFVVLLFCWCYLLPAVADQPPQAAGGPIKVFTQNLYVGADLLRVVNVTSPEQIPVAVAQTLAIVQQTNFPERAKVIAGEIRQIQPDVIGLQEVSTIRTQFPGDFFEGNPQPAQDVMYDYLQILLDELKKQGMHYSVAAIVENADVEAPAFAGLDPAGIPQFMDVRLTDHDVILARNYVKVKNATAQHYQINLQIPVIENVFSIDFTRGYITVDARVRGRWYRFANTHLELPGPAPVSLVQAMQAQELISYLSQSPLPVVLVGDFNSSPEDTVDSIGAVPPYMQLVMSNFVDTWTHRLGKPLPGYTCCQNEELNNEVSLLNMRIDHTFVRDSDGDPSVLNNAVILANTVGDDPTDKTSSGLWPSDHAGVWNRIHLLPAARGHETE